MSFKLFERKPADWLDRSGNIKPGVEVVPVSMVTPGYHAGWMTRTDADALLIAHNSGAPSVVHIVDGAAMTSFEGTVSALRGLGDEHSERLEFELTVAPAKVK